MSDVKKFCGATTKILIIKNPLPSFPKSASNPHTRLIYQDFILKHPFQSMII